MHNRQMEKLLQFPGPALLLPSGDKERLHRRRQQRRQNHPQKAPKPVAGVQKHQCQYQSCEQNGKKNESKPS